MKRLIMLLGAWLFVMPVSGQQLGLVGVDYTTSEGKQVDSETEFIGFNASYYNFMGNDWFVGLNAEMGEGDSRICFASNCLDLESDYREFGLELGYSFGYLTPFVGASQSNVESEFAEGEIEHLEAESDSSEIVRLGVWAGTESWRFRLALDDVTETKALSIGGYSKIGDSGFAASIFLETPLDSDTVEGHAIRLQVGFLF